MSPTVFGVAFTIGAGALALWTDARVPRLAPGEMRWIFLHTAAAFAVLHLVAGVGVSLIASGPPVALVSVVGIALPGVAYAFLVGIWTIKFFQSAYDGMR